MKVLEKLNKEIHFLFGVLAGIFLCGIGTVVAAIIWEVFT